MNRRYPSRYVAFSLVELLVVIGILSVLIAILLPALNRAREAAKTVSCLSNLRQLAVAAQNYASAYNGSYPPGYYSTTNGNISYGYNWDFTIVLNLNTGVRTIQPGLVWMGKTIAQIQQCPSFDGRSNTLLDPYTGYNYNTSYIGHGDQEISPGQFIPPTKINSVRKPSETALFGDGQYVNGANKYMRAPLSNPLDPHSAAFAGTQGFRHHRQTNLAYCDGHAESLKDRYIAGNSRVVGGTGFISEDNRLYDLD